MLAAESIDSITDELLFECLIKSKYSRGTYWYTITKEETFYKKEANPASARSNSGVKNRGLKTDANVKMAGKHASQQ
jgi:hypothetical protein